MKNGIAFNVHNQIIVIRIINVILTHNFLFGFLSFVVVIVFHLAHVLVGVALQELLAEPDVEAIVVFALQLVTLSS